MHVCSRCCCVLTRNQSHCHRADFKELTSWSTLLYTFPLVRTLSWTELARAVDSSWHARCRGMLERAGSPSNKATLQEVLEERAARKGKCHKQMLYLLKSIVCCILIASCNSTAQSFSICSKRSCQAGLLPLAYVRLFLIIAAYLVIMETLSRAPPNAFQCDASRYSEALCYSLVC